MAEDCKSAKSIVVYLKQPRISICLSDRRIRIGTRGSPLALAQAREVQTRLVQANGLKPADVPIVEIVTSGDRIQDRPLSKVGGKGLFTKEIEQALFDRRIDVAVHSMKDLETALPHGLALSAVLEREDVRDAFIGRKYKSLAEMPAGAVVGTSSIRRRAQLHYVRPDLKIVEFRGNVQTRLRKLDDGIADATFLACAGLRRLGLDDGLGLPLEPGQMLPAVAQGAIALQIRATDTFALECTAPLNHRESFLRTKAERAFLARLNGSCRTPIAGLATINAMKLDFHGQVLLPDGSQCIDIEHHGPAEDAETIGRAAATQLLQRAGPDILRDIINSNEGHT